MSNAIIKQQGDSPIVADNIWEIRLGAGSFIFGGHAGDRRSRKAYGEERCNAEAPNSARLADQFCPPRRGESGP